MIITIISKDESLIPPGEVDLFSIAPSDTIPHIFHPIESSDIQGGYNLYIHFVDLFFYIKHNYF